MMNDLNLEDPLKRIEKLLVANKEILSLEEACEYTGISRSYKYKLICAGKIPHSKPRRKTIYFDKKQLNSWLLGNSKP